MGQIRQTYFCEVCKCVLHMNICMNVYGGRIGNKKVMMGDVG